MKKIVNAFVLFILLLIISFLNLGKWLDVTDKPSKADIIVCLGGGTIERVKKSIALYEQGYASKKVFVLLGESWYNQPYIKKHYPQLPIQIGVSPQNTVEEVTFIIKYMEEHGYSSALIVTDPPHTRRVHLLLSNASDDTNGTFMFHLIGSDVLWWDKDHYYENKHARLAAWSEGLKVLYTALTCSIL